MNLVRDPSRQRTSSARVASWTCVLGLLLGAASACSSLGEDGFGGTTTTTAVPTTAVPTTAVPTTAVPTTAVPTTAVPTTAVPTTVVGVLGSNQLPDGSLPRTGPSEAAVLAAVGCALLVAGRLALDGLRWLDRLHLARTGRPRSQAPPR